MRDSTAALREGDAQLLRGRLQTDGYLLLRDLIPAGSVQAGCRRITEEMGRGGWFVGDPPERIARAGGPSHSLGPVDDKFSATNGAMLRPSEARAVCNSADGAVLRVLEAPELHAAFELLFGEPAITLDYKWFRTVRPPAEPSNGSLNGSGIFHCDKVSAAANCVFNALYAQILHLHMRACVHRSTWAEGRAASRPRGSRGIRSSHRMVGLPYCRVAALWTDSTR